MGEKLRNTLGMIGGQLLGPALGMMMEKRNDERQIKQQMKLQEMQIRGQKEMTDYQNAAALQMWRDTNYGPQVEEMKKAGLNPALLYGMSGGGGATAHSASGNVGSGNAPTGGGEVMGGLGMGMQMGLMEAQRKVLESQARLNNTEADKKEGVDTDLGRTQINSLAQGIENQKAAAEMTNIQNRILKIDEWIKDKTKDDQIDAIGWQAEKVMNEMSLLHRQNLLESRVYEDRIKIVRTELAGMVLRNLLTQEQTAKTKSDIHVNEQTIKKMVADIEQKWKELDIRTFEAEIKANYPSLWQIPGNMWQKAYQTLDNIFKEKTDHTPIKIDK